MLKIVGESWMSNKINYISKFHTIPCNILTSYKGKNITFHEDNDRHPCSEMISDH